MMLEESRGWGKLPPGMGSLPCQPPHWLPHFERLLEKWPYGQGLLLFLLLAYGCCDIKCQWDGSI